MCECSSGRPPGSKAPPNQAAVRPELHEGLAIAVARRFRWAPVPFEDLLQAARLGLVEAAARFDASAGVSFTTYALPIMLGEVRRLVEKDRAVSGIRSARALVREAERHKKRLEAERGRDVTVADVARAMGVDAAELAAAIGAMADPVPMEAARAASPGSAAAADRADLEAWTDRVAVRQALGLLPPDLRRIVYLRYFRGWSQQEVAQALGMSQPVVSRRERLALAALRQSLEAHPVRFPAWRQLPEG